MTIKTPIRCAALLFALLAGANAHAGLLDDEEARKAIVELRAKVDALAKDLNARIDTKADKNVSVDFVNQHEQDMAELAKLRGQLEVLANEIANTQKKQRDLYGDLDARLKKLEPREVTIDGKKTSVDPAEQKAYDAAMALFNGHDFAGAAQSFADFVRRYPDSGYAANAQYKLGAAYYAASDYKNAIAANQVLLSAYADSPQAPDAMLNIASCYTQLKDKKNAKKTYQELVKKYPDSPAAQTAKDRLATLK